MIQLTSISLIVLENATTATCAALVSPLLPPCGTLLVYICGTGDPQTEPQKGSVLWIRLNPDPHRGGPYVAHKT